MAANYDELGFVPENKAKQNDFGFVPDKSDDTRVSMRNPNLFGDSFKQFLKDPVADLNAAVDIVNEGQRRFLTGIAGAGDYVSDKLFGTNKTDVLNAQSKAKEAEFNKKYGDNIGAKVGVFAAENAPLFAAGNIFNLSKAGSIPGLIGKNAAFGAGSGAVTYDPDKSVPEKVAENAILQGVAGPLLAKGGDAYEKARLANLFGNADKADIMRNMGLAGDLPMNIGDVIESPGLKRLQENVLARIPGSGVSATQRIVADAIRDKGDSLLQSIKGNYKGSDINADIAKILDETGRGVHGEKRALYKAVDEAANKAGLPFTAPNYQSAAKNLLEEIESNPFQDLKKDELVSTLKKATADKSGTLKNANIFRGQLGDEISQAYRNGDLNKVRVLKQLKDGLDTDIESFFSKHPDENVKNLYANAQNFYKDMVAPFDEREITRFTKKDGDTDLLLSSFIKTGQNDRGNLAQKLMQVIGEENKNLPGYGYLSKAIKVREDGTEYLDARQLSQLIDKLKPKQFEALFPDVSVRKELKAYSELAKKNGEALTQMQNAATGQRLGELAIGGIGAMIAEAMLKGGTPTAALTGLGGIAGTIGGARGLNKILTSPKVREMYLKSMQKGDRKLPSALRNTLVTSPSADY